MTLKRMTKIVDKPSERVCHFYIQTRPNVYESGCGAPIDEYYELGEGISISTVSVTRNWDLVTCMACIDDNEADYDFTRLLRKPPREQ